MQPHQADAVINALDAWLASMFDAETFTEAAVEERRAKLREALIASGQR